MLTCTGRETETKIRIKLKPSLTVGRVVLIKDYLKRNAQWRIGRIEGRVIGKDGVTRGYKVRTSNGNLLERPVQLMADLEVGGEREKSRETHQETKLNPMAPEFQPQRPSRKAKETARNRLVGIGLNDQESQDD